MMNYYIKALRSNLDNILSSESISPFSFYQNRSFGYHRYDRLKDDIYDNVLRVDPTIYDDPDDVIYLEINGDDMPVNNLVPKERSCSFYVPTTIYLYPWNCRILFKTVEDARSSIFLCRSSLTNKMWGYYTVGLVNNIENDPQVILSPNGDSFYTQGQIDDDNRKNRLKGFLFGYYSGLSISLSPELAQMLQVEMRIYGLATAMAGMRFPSAETFLEIDRLKKIFNACDPNQARLKRLWNENVLGSFSTPSDGELFERLLGRLGVQKTAMYAFAAEQGVDVSPRLDSSKMLGSEWSMFAQQIDDYTRRIIERAVEEKNVTEEERAYVKGGTIQIQKVKGTLYEDIVNEIVEGNTWLLTERLSSKRMEVANELTHRLKDYDESHGLVWEGSEHQLYLESMRQNIAYSSPFDPNQTKDKWLRALAVYVLKGDIMDELIKYVQYIGIEDYSLVYGLWGANIGYANLPKTFISKVGLTEQKTSCCYWEICREFIDEKSVPKLDANKFITDIKHLEANNVQSTRKKKPEEKKTVEDGIKEAIERLKDEPTKLTVAQLLDIRSLLERNNGRISEQSIRQIGKIRGIGKKKLEQIRAVLESLVDAGDDMVLFNESIAEGPKQASCLTPSVIMSVIDDCLPDDEMVRNQVEKDISWFLKGQGVLSPNIISKLCQYLKRNKEVLGRRGARVHKLYADVDVNKIERRLIETFNVIV